LSQGGFPILESLVDASFPLQAAYQRAMVLKSPVARGIPAPPQPAHPRGPPHL